MCTAVSFDFILKDNIPRSAVPGAVDWSRSFPSGVPFHSSGPN